MNQSLEARIHRAITPYLTKREQGWVMGAIRKELDEAVPYPLREYHYDQWWLKELENLIQTRTVTDDTIRAAFITRNFANAVFTAPATTASTSDDREFIIEAVTRAKVLCVHPEAATTIDIGKAVLAAYRATLAPVAAQQAAASNDNMRAAVGAVIVAAEAWRRGGNTSELDAAIKLLAAAKAPAAQAVARVERIVSTGGVAEVVVFLESALKVGTLLYASPASTPEASQQAAAEPIYQVQYQGSAGTSLWHDATEAAYHTFMPERRRIVYTGKQAADVEPPLQQRVTPWMMACFGPEISADKIERNHRFFEEATELVQAGGMTKEDAYTLVDYVYGRPVGEKGQEVGGVMITLAAWCLANGLDMHAEGETELARIWTKVEAIRAKQASKPRGSAVPIPMPPKGLNDGQQNNT